jgi:hypothetical protein
VLSYEEMVAAATNGLLTAKCIVDYMVYCIDYKDYDVAAWEIKSSVPAIMHGDLESLMPLIFENIISLKNALFNDLEVEFAISNTQWMCNDVLVTGDVHV